VVAGSYGSSPVVTRLAEALVDLVGVRPHESIIDVGTGTGLALVRAANVAGAGTALGVDRSFAMLKVAARRTTEATVGATLCRGDAARLPVRDGSFDVAFAASVWQFLGYESEALAEWRRVLRPGGRLGFSVPGAGSGASIAGDLMNKYFAFLTPAVQEDFISRATARPQPDLAEAAHAAGFTNVTVADRTWEDSLGSTAEWWAIQSTHAVRFFLDGLDADAQEALKAEAVDRLSRSDSGGVIVTTEVRYCVARL